METAIIFLFKHSTLPNR